MQVIRGFSTNVSRSAWLHWLNILGNVELWGEVSLRGRGQWAGRLHLRRACSAGALSQDCGGPHPMLPAMRQPPLVRGTGQ